MRIFLDAKDLIDLVEHGRPVVVAEFHKWLASKGHVLVLSPTVVFELSAPIVRRGGKTVVTGLLNDLESLRPKYIADGLILPAEIRQAIDARTSGSEYQDIDPYVPRLDYALEALGPLATRMYLHFPLSEIVWTISQSQPSVFEEKPQREQRLRRMLSEDRSVAPSISLRRHFGVKLGRDIRGYGIPDPDGGCEALAEWIYESPKRCPSLRLDYEVYHALRRNATDPGHLQDFEDLGHIRCVPYVDVMTLDRRMSEYVRQVGSRVGDSFGDRVEPDLDAVIARCDRAV